MGLGAFGFGFSQLQHVIAQDVNQAANPEPLRTLRSAASERRFGGFRVPGVLIGRMFSDTVGRWMEVMALRRSQMRV